MIYLWMNLRPESVGGMISKTLFLPSGREVRHICIRCIEREREIRKFHVPVVQRQLRNVARKKRDARAKFLFC